MGVGKIDLGYALALLLCLPSSLPGVDSQTVWENFHANDSCNSYSEVELVDGLQSLWTAWNKSTPHTESNLLNWQYSGGPFHPCFNAAQNWRGVLCLRYQVNATQYDMWVVGLDLNNASIGGILPPAINQMSTLVYLTLTGNPNLQGYLPKEVADLPLDFLDLHGNGFYGIIPAELGQISSLLQLDLSGNKFTGPPPALSNLTELNKLNLSRNNFSELPEIPDIFNSWLPSNSLGVLDLSGLNIGGGLPDWESSSGLLSIQEVYLDSINVSGVLNINSILHMTSTSDGASRTIQVLSLRDNNITDVLFEKQFLMGVQSIKFLLQGNPYCTTNSKDLDGRRCFCEQYCAISDPPSNKRYWKVIVITSTICGFLLGSVILGLVIILHRKNKHVHALMKQFEESDVRTKKFEYNVLRAATKNFAEERKLGQGAYGAVYKGILTSTVEIAVKQLFMQTQQANEDFLNEVLLITNLQHRNLVALKGYCLHGKEMLLVYELVDNCDLDKFLFQESTHANMWQVVDWPARMNICLGVAQGLYYLHASSQTKIIHRDIKASNILLDKNLNPKIADFGLARLIQGERTEIMTQQRVGTLGYWAPEYLLYGQLSEKADVYSFGVLLMEIVSGSRNKDLTQPDDKIYLPTRAWKLHKEDKLMDVMDPRLHVTEVEAMEVRRVLEIATMCVQSSPETRPTMFKVVAMLAGDASIVAIPIDDCNSWPEFQTPSRSHFEDPLLTASSSSTGLSTARPFTNGNATIELSTLYMR